MADDVENKAIAMFQAQSVAWTGHVWDWEKAGDDVKAYWREVAAGSRKPDHAVR